MGESKKGDSNGIGGFSNSAILVVEDNDDCRMTLVDLLHSFGFHVVYEACDGSDGIRVYLNHPEIDLVVTDLQMPVLDGVGLAHEILKISQERHYKKPKFLCITGKALDQPEICQLRSKGLDCVLRKPADGDLIKSTAFSLLESR